ncbi:MAG: permease prefix domain 1-containing protein [Planctomycetota bacterium]
MSTSVRTKSEYLERLRDLLPYRESRRILEEVDGLLQDRMDAEKAQDGISPEDAERRAIAALGPAETLAEQLVQPAIRVDLGTRRTFSRMLAVTFATHLLLSIVLTVAGTSGPAIPGLLAPLPTGPLAATLSAVLSVLLMDTGGLFLLFALLGKGKAPALLPALHLRPSWSRRDAALALVLLGLMALILHPFRDQIFAVRDGDHLVGILAPDLIALLPFVDVALVLLAVRQVVILKAGGEHVLAIVVDALASLALAAVLVVAATRPELVVFPRGSVGQRTAQVLSDLTTRVLMLVFLGAALFLTVRFVKRLLRVRQWAAQR